MYKFKFILLFVTRFETLSKRDKSTPINMKSLQYLAAKLFKVRNGLSPEIMKEIFAFQENEAYSLRSGVCVCVCVCLCVFMLFHLLVSSDSTTFVTSVRSSDQQSFVVSISRGFCQVPSSLFLNLSYFTSKEENSSWQPLERKQYDIMLALGKMIYINIGYNTAIRLAVKLRKDTEDKEATLI